MTTPTTLIILGACGDLTRRLLLPGLGSLLARQPERNLRIVGADRAALSNDAFADRLQAALTDGGADPTVAAQYQQHASYHEVDVTDPAALAGLLSQIEPDSQLVLYFALPPAITGRACRALLSCDLPADAHLVVEKPFGSSLDSARELNDVVERLVPDEQVHRVDHFLGKSTVLDIIALRFANRMLQAIWHAEAIDSIEIVYEEALALEGRAGYYDHAGALEDMFQSHLLQVMSVITMEQPSQITGREVRDAKSTVLRATRLWGGEASIASRRARYTKGTIGDRTIPSYVDEDGVDPGRNTETMAQVTVEVANQRWAGVPITLRSGKALGHTRKQVIINIANVHHLPEGLRGAPGQDQLIIGLDPDAMELHLTTNSTADPLALEQSVLSTPLRQSDLNAYGEVLAAVLDGETMLSVRGDAAEECWRITDQVLDAWRAGQVPMEEYPAGSQAPQEWTSHIPVGNVAFVTPNTTVAHWS